MTIYRKLIYSGIATILASVVALFLPLASIPVIDIDNSAARLPYAIGKFTGRFFIIFGLALTLTYLVYFFFFLMEKQHKFPERKIFFVSLVISSLITLAAQTTEY